MGVGGGTTEEGHRNSYLVQRDGLHRRLAQDMTRLDSGSKNAWANALLVQFGIAPEQFIIVHSRQHAPKAVARKSLGERKVQ